MDYCVVAFNSDKKRLDILVDDGIACLVRHELGSLALEVFVLTQCIEGLVDECLISHCCIPLG